MEFVLGIDFWFFGSPGGQCPFSSTVSTPLNLLAYKEAYTFTSKYEIMYYERLLTDANYWQWWQIWKTQLGQSKVATFWIGLSCPIVRSQRPIFSGPRSSASSLDLFGQGKQFSEIFEVFLRLEGLNQKILLHKKVLEVNSMVLYTPKKSKI